MIKRISEAGLVYEIPHTEMNVYDEIMGDQVYSIDRRILERSQKCFRVIDIGAHVGLSTLYYWLAWQDSGLPGNFRADCYEPHPDLYEMCWKNCQAATNGISVINAAVVQDEEAKAKPLAIQELEGHLCCSRVVENASHQVKTVSAADTLKYMPAGDIDILKIDTEGMEPGILQGYADAKAIDRFRCVMVEYHWEKDRRAIDALLPNHTLYDTKLNIGRNFCVGVVKYIRNDFVGA